MTMPMLKDRSKLSRPNPGETTIAVHDETRRQLRIIAALTDSTIKEVLVRIVGAELRKVQKGEGS